MKENLVLVDTSIWIETFARSVNAKVKTEMETLLLEQRVTITGLIKLELLGGASDEAEFEKLKQDLDALPELELVPEVWTGAYKLSYRLRRAGLTLPNADILLSTLASHHRCWLWHRDRHFDLIARHLELRLYRP